MVTIKTFILAYTWLQSIWLSIKNFNHLKLYLYIIYMQQGGRQGTGLKLGRCLTWQSHFSHMIWLLHLLFVYVGVSDQLSKSDGDWTKAVTSEHKGIPAENQWPRLESKLLFACEKSKTLTICRSDCCSSFKFVFKRIWRLKCLNNLCCLFEVDHRFLMKLKEEICRRKGNGLLIPWTQTRWCF